MTRKLNLGQYLKNHSISAYRLVQEVQGIVAPNTVYALARKPAQRIDIATVDKLLLALSRVRGEPVKIDDVLAEVAPEDPARAPDVQDVPVYDAGQRKVFRYGGYRIRIAPGPSVQEILDDLRGHNE